GIVKNLTQGSEIPITPLPDVMIKILNEGGLAKHIEKHGDFQLT
ncbi:MAG TPA: 3-isopropylmalate dehydratase, partial [Cyanobacteria bacterium UBA9579]|nr:3-isopropylmalate dehydratase [Cyanobacteria bacterium UBA9579]